MLTFHHKQYNLFLKNVMLPPNRSHLCDCFMIVDRHTLIEGTNVIQNLLRTLNIHGLFEGSSKQQTKDLKFNLTDAYKAIKRHQNTSSNLHHLKCP